MNDKQMHYTDHVTELRNRLLVTAVFFVIAFAAGIYLSGMVVEYLQHTLTEKQFTLNAFRLTDPMYVFLMFAFIIALTLTMPLFLYQLWAFVSPALYKHERRITLMYIPFTVLLFLLGIGFSYFVLFPYAVDFMLKMAGRLQIEGTFGVYQYFTFLLQITIPFGFLFQLPLLAMFLTRLGIVNPDFLRSIRKYAYFVLLILAGLITPPDVISQLIVMAPLVVLYECSIVISRLAYRKVLKAQGMVYNE